MGNIISSILQDGRQRKKWLDRNFIVLSVGSNKRTRHSKIIDLTSNTFPAHVEVCLLSQLNRYRCLHTFLSAMITLPNLSPFLLLPKPSFPLFQSGLPGAASILILSVVLYNTDPSCSLHYVSTNSPLHTL